MNKIFAALPALALAAIAAPALAADLPAAAVVAAAPPAAPTTTTLAIEVSPEFKAAAGSTQNDLADWYAKGTLSYAIAPGWTIAGAAQYTAKLPAGGFDDLYQAQVEGSIAYKFKLTDTFSVTGTGGLGFTWGDTGYAGGQYTHGSGAYEEAGNGDDSFGYYYLQGQLDAKLNSHWTWNVVQARYRNAFNETWITPKVATGLTYTIDPNDAIYANVGYAWKDKGDGNGLQSDKWNIAVGYKYSF